MSTSILMVTHYYGLHLGGIELVAERLAQELVSDSDIHIVWMASAPAPAVSTSRKDLCYHPVKAWNFTENQLGFPYPLWSPFALIRLWVAVRQSDVVLVHDAIYLANFLAILMGRLSKKKTVIVQHIGIVPYNSFILRTLMSMANRLLVMPTLSIAHRVVFISHITETFFSANGVRYKNPPQLIFNGVDTSCFKPDNNARTRVIEAIGVNPDAPMCLFVGRFVEKKGLLVLRRIVEQTPHITWIFAGHGPLDPVEWNLPNVYVERERSKASLAELYQAADLLVLPSVGEGFPLVIQESVACGLPVLCTNETARADPDAQAFIYALPLESDVQETALNWVSYIQDILQNKLSNYPYEMATQYAQTCWSWQETVKKYQEMIHGI